MLNFLFRWGTHLYMSLFRSVHPSVHLSVVHHTSGTIHHLIIIFGTRVKWWYLQVSFALFWNFDFFVFRRVKVQKMAQNDKKICPLHFISQEPYVIWSSFMVHMCNRIISPGVLYIFINLLFCTLIFGVNSWVKEQKMV